ncbi:RidA family protein [Streptococcus moroccensis]|uniref:2-iminobutanoate/2-iminopropanoate deaminase n=1 Tax=Streptococcus moroccensis TaxID=1451356 RepID=A0ABT9YTZ1_9STRE|nr:RidA family protein [Streptococcus moroccensis]MDQ0223072.1 2-iminobutanoate/2-iminopropanoate deaminase [Streptococcus moroccensis]
MIIINTDKAPGAIGPYVQGKVVGNLLFASGQVPLSPETGEVVGVTIEEQTEQVLKNIEAILEAAGTDFDHVVKTTCFLKDMNDFVAFNGVYATAFKADFPARSAVEVARLPRDVKVEIEVIAEITKA